MKSWTGEMMNMARRIQINKWMEKKNEHKASVQRRWDNKGIVKEAFKRCKSSAGYMETKQWKREIRKTTTRNERRRHMASNTAHWGRVRITPRIHIQVRNFMREGIG
eukprot:6175573-Pleurochrysis_carterae.AAC.1